MKTTHTITWLFSACFLLIWREQTLAQPCPPLGEPPPVKPGPRRTISSNQQHATGWDVSSETAIINPGITIKVNGDFTLKGGGELINCGRIEVIGKLFLSQGGIIRNYGTLIVKSDIDMQLSNLENHGTMTVEGNMRSYQNVENYGTINVVKEYTNNGGYNRGISSSTKKVKAATSSKLVVGGNMINNNAQVHLYGTLSVGGIFFMTNSSARIYPDAKLVVQRLYNSDSGSIQVRHGGLVKVRGTLHNSGRFSIGNKSLKNKKKGGLCADRISNRNKRVASDLELCQVKYPNDISGRCKPSIDPSAKAKTKDACKLGLLDPTPVELLFFRAVVATDRAMKVEWKTVSERNNDYFNLYRSFNGGGFEKIYQINGQGTTQIPHYYHTTDQVFVTGTYYYQLEQVDYDGTVKRFPVIKVKQWDEENSARQVWVYPLPAPSGSRLFVRLPLPKDIPVEGHLFNVSGRKLASLQKIQGTRSHGLAEFQLMECLPGIYLLQLKTPMHSYLVKVHVSN